jgi:septal ring factor EnvC (AmiA/AmiB activator)
MPITNGHGPKRAILYARVSTDEQAKKGFSILDQLRALRDYAAREHYDVIEEVEDDGYSGGDPYRPGLQRVREPAEDMGRFARLLDEIEGKRARFQHLYAEGVIGIDDLQARLSELDAIHSQTARRMDELEAHRKRLKSLEHDKEEVLASYAALTRKRLEELPPKIGTVSTGASTSQSESRAAASPSSRPTSTWRLVKTQCPLDDPRLYPWRSPRGAGYREILVRA